MAAPSKPEDSAGLYRVVNVLVMYDETKERVLGGRKRTLQVRRAGTFGQVIELSAAEADRLLAYGGIKSADAPRSYDELLVDELEALAAERGVVAVGTGANGHKLKADYVLALEQADEQVAAPAVVVAPAA